MLDAAKAIFARCLLCCCFSAHAHGSEVFDRFIEARFYGSSTLLFDDGETQILIDGFFSRQRYSPFFGKIEPDLSQIRDAVLQTGVCIAAISTEHPDCRSGTNLRLLIPAHGHYDHALDIGVLAHWSGVDIVADASIRSVIAASKELDFSELGSVAPTQPKILPLSEGRKKPLHLGKYGVFDISLIPAEHFKPLGLRIFPGVTSAELEFPVSLHELKLGTPVNILLKHPRGNILVVPSAGMISKDGISALPNIDTVFLGIGGLDIPPSVSLRRYWENVLSAFQAKSVYLVHWDSDRKKINYDKPEFSLARPALMRKAIDWFLRQSNDDTLVMLPPAIERFSAVRGLR